MTTNERTSDDVPPPASTKPAAPSDARVSDVPASAPSGVAPLSGRASSAPGTKKRKKKKKANGASVTPPPAAVAAGAPAPTSKKSVPPPSAANTNGAAEPSGREDDESVPPAADLDHHFFESQSAIRAHDSLHPLSHADDVKAPDPRLAALMREETLRRRAQFTKYVKVIFAGAIVVCLAAVISFSVRRNHPDETVAAAATTPMRPMRQAPVPLPSSDDPVDPSAQTAALTPTADTPTGDTPTAEPAASVDPTPSTTAAASDTAPAPPPSASAAASAEPSATVAAVDPTGDAPAELDPKAALKERRQAQRSLDNGKIADAIDHGEASVKLDPTDAEAWLLLGAAYQMKGDLASAKRSFGSCLKEGKRGPRGECAAMPH